MKTLRQISMLLLVVVIAMPTLAHSQRIRGYADLHTHQFANEGFGARHFFGRAFGPLADSVPWCSSQHGPGGVFDLATAALRPMYGAGAGGQHKVGGNPDFDGWPRWDSVTHQSMHEDWLQRSMRGGLRLIVVLAVNNEWMCSTLESIDWHDQSLLLVSPPLAPEILATKIAASQFITPETCKDMVAVDRQLAEARRMEEYVDDKSGGPGKGWYRIVGSPDEARKVISEGKLAVVLGVEVDNLFGCDKNSTSCTEAYVSSKLDKYYSLGVRHVFAIHFYDNAFGGSANSNALITMRWKNSIQTRDCRSLGYEYDDGKCNALGLTDIGKFLIRGMVRRGMMIDVDHMSEQSFNDAMDILEPMHYPVVSGHTGFTEISRGDENNEGNKTPQDLMRIQKVGGMVAIIPHQGSLDEIKTLELPGGSSRTYIPHTCGNSSETVAQAYLYAVQTMSGTPVGFGTDFNGFAGSPGPRFGDESCSGGRSLGAQARGKVQYPFTLRATDIDITLGQSVVGNKIFDFNTDGLAHIGMLPDLIADLQAMGVKPRELDPLFDSAEGYIRVWERSLNPRKRLPGVTCSPVSAQRQV